MCGISVILAVKPHPDPQGETIGEMVKAQQHRGPDGTGVWSDRWCSIGHNRLRVVDPTDGSKQPILSDDGRYVFAYNGELYNYHHVRASLEARGDKFKSQGDTEVIFRYLLRFGPEALSQLDGMFAWVLWDTKERTLTAGRDRFGIKPLFVAHHQGKTFLASEIKGLAAAGVPMAFDESTLHELLVFRYVAGESTPFSGVERIPPGSVWKWQWGRTSTTPWPRNDMRTHNDTAVASEYGAALTQEVHSQCIADVHVGVMLSGGIDSSSIAALAATHAGNIPQARGTLERMAPPHGFHVGFESPRYDESQDAQAVAQRLGLQLHHTRIASKEVIDLFREAQRYLDEPVVHASEGFILRLAQQAKDHVTVLLSGEGADETLAGYVRYRPLAYPVALQLLQGARAGHLLSRLPHGRLTKLGKMLQLGSLQNLGLYNTAELLPQTLREYLGTEPSPEFEVRHTLWEQTHGPLWRRTMDYDQATFLRSLLDRNDRMTMAASIECRVPFLGAKPVGAARGFSRKQLLNVRGGKTPLRQFMAGALPSRILAKPKWGFGVPWEQYLAADARDLVREIESDGLAWTALSKKDIARSVAQFRNGDPTAYLIVRQLCFLKLWYEESLVPLGQLARANAPRAFAS